jgi:DNA-binding response OmpR family regulator
MKNKNLTTGKHILIVDDEPDVLDTLEDLLPDCSLERATRFEDARRLLETRDFELAILDIMGVDGYRLLEICTRRNILAVMLTAGALSPEDTVKSFRGGAAYYVPKDEIARIETFLNEIFKATENAKNPWIGWLERFSPYYNKRFGPDWQHRDKAFWDRFIERYSNW